MLLKRLFKYTKLTNKQCTVEMGNVRSLKKNNIQVMDTEIKKTLLWEKI